MYLLLFPIFFIFFLNIEAEKGTRTLDPRITNALLYQLSYFGIYKLLPYAIG